MLGMQSHLVGYKDIPMLRDVPKPEKDALLSAIIATSDDAIVSKTLDGIITSWNASAERMFCYTAEEALGCHISLIIPPERLQEERLILEALQKGEPIHHFETVRIAKDGKRLDLSLSISPVMNGEGQIVGGAKIARDITAQKQSAEILTRHIHALELSNKDLEDFADIASHDLKEPLRGLSSNAAILYEDCSNKLDVAGIQRLGRIQYLAKQMERRIDNLLSYSRLGRQEMAMQATDLNEVVREIVSILDTPLEEQNAVVNIVNALPNIVCDRTRISEVFINLITNAVKYNSRDNRVVDVGYIPKMNAKKGIMQNVFFVRDNGVGIKEEFHEEIFRMFKRLNCEDSSKRGSGVGLTFVRKIVDRHGGQIWLESVPGEGTTFYFTLTEGIARDATAAASWHPFDLVAGGRLRRS